MLDEEEGGNYEEITEQMIDVEEILSLYATPEIISKAGLLLREYEFNKPEVNRAICKLLHRVAFDLKQPAMCFQASIFYTFQQINKNQVGTTAIDNRLSSIGSSSRQSSSARAVAVRKVLAERVLQTGCYK